MRRLSFLMSFIVLLSGVSANAAPKTYEIDPYHTNIMWFASHFGFSKSMGQFMSFKGTLILDEQDPAASSVEVTIQTASIIDRPAKI